MKKIALLLLAFLLWIVLVWPFRPDTGLQWQDVGAGVLVAVLVTVVMREVPAQDLAKWIDPVRYFWTIVYIPVLSYYILAANLDVVYRVLHPDMPIRPGIVRVRTSLKTLTAVTALANSITLTPGTLTVNATEDGILYIHWINVVTDDDEEAARHITKRFEWFLKRIFE